VTQACPEIVERIRGVPARSLVLDGEAIALNREGRPHPFQTTMRRFGRKLDVAALRNALPLTSVFFDCLFLDGVDLTSRPASERFEILRRTLGEDLVVPRLVTSDVEDARTFVQKAIDAGHEGIMAKSLEAPYEAGSRGKAWLKLKTAETLDLVVLAAEWGSGRRRGWLSNLHLGARDPSTGDFVMLGKTFKGMTDEILAWQTKRLQEIATEKGDWVVRVRPELVVEIAFNDIQKSPHYPGGLALRFARLKTYRDDKRPDEADTIETVREIYRRRTGDSLEASERQLALW
jgi:DNA ligase-1